MQLRARHIARNVVFNWIGSVANMAVGFFLSPFILHRLGDVANGVWILSVSMISYLYLLDLGMQNSVLRFVSKGHTKGDHQGASDALSAALWVRLQISGLVLLLSGGIAAVFPLMIKIPPELAGDARKAILVIGLNTAISMSIGVFGGVLSGLNRYDLQNYIELVKTAVRVVGIVIVLRMGYGIVAIAFCELVAVIVANIILLMVAYRLYPELQVRLKKPKRETLRQIWTYSSYAFLTTIAVKLVYQTDNLVVGSFVSASAVTFYAIANNLCRYTGQIVDSMGNTFVPAASTYESANDTQSLMRLYKNGTRMIMMISLPVLITLMIRGHSFIGLWMGPEYAQSSGTVLMLLLVGLLFSYVNRTASAIAFGVEKHKTLSFWAIGEGVANLVLSITLVHWYGIYGVAIGTLIPSLVIQVIMWPGYIKELVGLSRFEVLWNVWGPVLLASVPFAIATWAMGRYFPAHNLLVFFLQVLATLPVFLLTVAVVFRGFVVGSVLPRVRSMFPAGAR